MTAAITDLITSPSNGTRPVSTTVEVSRSTGITSLSCADLTGWSTTTPVHFVTYKIDGQGNVVAGSQADWKGIVSGTTINSLVITGGTDAGNSVGDIVEILPTARWGKELTDALLKEHNVDGTHGTIATLNATNATVTGILTASGSVTLPAASVTASNIDFTTFKHKIVYDIGTVNSNPASVMLSGDYVAQTITGTTNGGYVDILATLNIGDGNSGAPRTGHFKLQCDGVDIPNSTKTFFTPSSGYYSVDYTTQVRHLPAAGSHTWKLIVTPDTGNATYINMNSLSVKEIL